MFENLKYKLRQVFNAFHGGTTAKHLELTTYTYPDGKLEQYLIEPSE
jgi:hypothetical protein